MNFLLAHDWQWFTFGIGVISAIGGGLIGYAIGHHAGVYSQ